MRKHHLMDHSGHKTIEFDPAKTADLDAAVARFNALREQGHTAATRNTGETEYQAPVKDFKDTKDETLFIPQLIGG